MNKNTLIFISCVVLLISSGYFYIAARKITVSNKLQQAPSSTVKPTINITALITSRPTLTPVVWDTYFIQEKYPEQLVLTKNTVNSSIALDPETKVYRIVDGVRKAVSSDELHQGMHIQVLTENKETVIIIPSTILNY